MSNLRPSRSPLAPWEMASFSRALTQWAAELPLASCLYTEQQSPPRSLSAWGEHGEGGGTGSPDGVTEWGDTREATPPTAQAGGHCPQIGPLDRAHGSCSAGRSGSIFSLLRCERTGFQAHTKAWHLHCQGQ